ncbi:MAG TPA: permease, partial [Nitrospiraceae bacterium]|nr:permease [Nitrospiraceae bacterium]
MMHRWLLSAALLFSFVAMPAGVGVAAQNAPAQKPAGAKAGAVTVQIDKTELKNGGTIMITGKAPRGKPVFIEVFAERTVRASRFDADVDKETKKRPYIFYMTHEMPAYYKIFAPKDRKEAIDKEKKEGKKWSVSKVLKDTGADAVYSAPTKIKIDRYQATLVGSIIGSRGSIMPAMDDKDNARRSMQLLK